MNNKENNYSGNNILNLTGVVMTNPEYSHTSYDEKFYGTNIVVDRLSGFDDDLKLVISEKILPKNLKANTTVNVFGQIRTYNKLTEEGTQKLVIFVFVRAIEVVDESNRHNNEATITGFVCKKPVFRKTPSGREITDVLVAVNRGYNKSDYLPCIAWGRNAKFVEEIAVGTKVSIVGRLQSRNYTKVTEENPEGVDKTAYEVSINRIKVNDEE
jgi:primosomal replication protein N